MMGVHSQQNVLKKYKELFCLHGFYIQGFPIVLCYNLESHCFNFQGNPTTGDSLTMGAGGLKNPWVDYKRLLPIFKGDLKISGGSIGGGITKSSPLYDSKILYSFDRGSQNERAKFRQIILPPAPIVDERLLTASAWNFVAKFDHENHHQNSKNNVFGHLGINNSCVGVPSGQSNCSDYVIDTWKHNKKKTSVYFFLSVATDSMCFINTQNAPLFLVNFLIEL